MNISETHIAFDMECDKSDSLTTVHFEPEEKDYWLNLGIRTFVKTRYSGVNSKGESFEQSQKRTDDLRTLVKEVTISCEKGSNKPNSYIATIESLEYPYWFTLGEEVLIAYVSLMDSMTVVSSGSLIVGGVYKVLNDSVTNNGIVYPANSYFIAGATTYTGNGVVISASFSREGVKEVDVNHYTAWLSNPFSEHILHYEKAKPLRLFLGDTVELITDGNYQVLVYYLRYLKKPAVVSLVGNIDCDLPEHTHDEIVKIAVNMALENIEHPRYQTHSREVSIME